MSNTASGYGKLRRARFAYERNPRSSSVTLWGIVDRFLRITLFAYKRSDAITRLRAHSPVSGERKSGIPAEVLTPDDH
jgi:hypothetical protein